MQVAGSCGWNQDVRIDNTWYCSEAHSILGTAISRSPHAEWRHSTPFMVLVGFTLSIHTLQSTEDRVLNTENAQLLLASVVLRQMSCHSIDTDSACMCIL